MSSVNENRDYGKRSQSDYSLALKLQVIDKAGEGHLTWKKRPEQAYQKKSRLPEAAGTI